MGIDTYVVKWFGEDVAVRRGVVLPEDKRCFDLYVATRTACKELSVECVLTCGREGIHSTASRHYLGLAIDVRIKNLDGDSTSTSKIDTKIAKAILSRVVYLLCGTVRGQVESSHIHLEVIGSPIMSGR